MRSSGPETLSLAYFEASLVVEHLVALNGDAGPAHAAAGVRRRRDRCRGVREGVRQERGRRRRVVQDVHRAAVRRAAAARWPARRRQVRSDELAGAPGAAAAAPGNFISQLQLGQALFKAGDVAGAKAALERAAQLAPQATGDDSPRALLAQIAEKEGDRRARAGELRELLESRPRRTSHAARRLVTLASRRRRPIDDEDFALRLVADLDPFDAEVHGQLGRRLLEKNDAAGGADRVPGRAGARARRTWPRPTPMSPRRC